MHQCVFALLHCNRRVSVPVCCPQALLQVQPCRLMLPFASDDHFHTACYCFPSPADLDPAPPAAETLVHFPAPSSMYPTAPTPVDPLEAPGPRPVTNAAAVWQHYDKSCPSSRAVGTTSPEAAPAETLVGWTEKIQHSDEQLMDKVGQANLCDSACL